MGLCRDAVPLPVQGVLIRVGDVEAASWIGHDPSIESLPALGLAVRTSLALILSDRLSMGRSACRSDFSGARRLHFVR